MQLTVLEPKIEFTNSNQYTIQRAIKGIDDYERNYLSTFKLNLKPVYQRGEARNSDFKENLIYSILTNYPIGTFVFRKLNVDVADQPTHEVVDGQQRLLAIKSFFDNSFGLSVELSNKVIRENENTFIFDRERGLQSNSVKILKKYESNNHSITSKLKFCDLPLTLQERILNYSLNVIEIIKCSDETIAQYFRYIQNQERLRAGEIINAIPDSKLALYLNKINNRDLFLEKINWYESRKEFEKIFYSMAGIFDNKLNFGTTDTAIIEYVGKYESMSDEAETSFLKMIKDINAITDCNAINSAKFSKRLIKFLFLSSGFGIIDYSINTELNFKTLLKIESKFPYFNSGKNDILEKVFNGYDENIIGIYNKLFILGRGSHSPKRTREVISELKTLFDYEQSKMNNENHNEV